MRRNIILITIVAFMGGLIACSGQKSDPDKYREGWTLVWEDDFNSKTGLTDWSKIPRGKQLMDRYMSDNEALYHVEDGYLVLRGVKNISENAEIPFLTGGITRQGTKKNGVNRIEVRARMNPVGEVVPFISLLPSDGSENIAIDIMKRFGYDEFFYQSVTSHYTTTEGMTDNPPSNALVIVSPSRFHTYGVETYPDSIVFFVDNKRTKTYPRISTDISGQFPFNELDLDLSIGIRMNNDPEPSELPVEMYVDWVRYYQPERADAAK